MQSKAGDQERGVALLFAIFALLLLSAIGASLVLVATTETTINFNYRSEAVSFFAARSGIAEVADRMMSTTASTPVITAPTAVPSATGGVLYLINQGALSTTVQPWVASTTNSPNIYMDDELCHDGYTLSGMTSTPPDVPCTTLPTGSGWYTTVTSNAPWNGTAAALPYVWVRVTLKLNGSVAHLNPVTNTTTDYYVNSSQPATYLVCWNGVSEVVASSPGISCSTGDTNVYLITALAVSSNGARTMAQSEVTVNSTPGTNFGLFATSTACPAITFSGNGTVNSYSTAGYTASNASSAYAATELQTGGNIGTDGSVSLAGNAAIGGSISAINANTGSCPAGLSTAGNAGMVKNQTPPNALVQISNPPPTITTPAAPNPLPPTTNVSYTKTTSLTAGSYGNISVSGNATVTLAPGVYNINSLSVAGNGVLTISPSTGAIVLNIAGTGQTTPLSIAGNGITNPSDIPSNVVINYAGTGSISIAGNGVFYAVVDAPNAALTYSGNGSFYGAMVGNTITDSGNGALHFDTALDVAATQADANYITIAFRELPY